MPWPWNPGYGSLKVIGTDTDRSATYDFLLTFHSNHGPISYRFRVKWRFRSKIANFSHPMYFAAPLKGFPLELVTSAGDKNYNDGATVLRKNFGDIFSRVIQYSNVTDGQTDGQTDTGRQQRPRLRIASRCKNFPCRGNEYNAYIYGQRSAL